MRGDLNMPAGKLAAQAAHCCAQSLLASLAMDPERLRILSRAAHSGSRVILRARHERQILAAYEEARSRDLPSALFYDSGHILPPHFDGNPILTGVGLGPASKAALRPVVRRFSCYT